MDLLRPLRFLGYALCAIVLGPELVGRLTEGTSPHGWVWLGTYGVFVLGYWLGAQAPLGASGNPRRWLALAIQEGAMVAMGLAAPCQFAALALVVSALQAALCLEPRRLAGVLVAQTAQRQLETATNDN